MLHVVLLAAGQTTGYLNVIKRCFLFSKSNNFLISPPPNTKFIPSMICKNTKRLVGPFKGKGLRRGNEQEMLLPVSTSAYKNQAI